MNDVSADEVVRDPQWLPHTFDVAGNALTFVNVPRTARAELRFLFDEHFGGRFRKTALPAASIAAALGDADPAPIHFIFHTSFCGSSLLARAFEIPGVSSSMREPAVTINLANRLIQDYGPANHERLELVLRLLERPLSPGEAVIAKQSNFANRLVEPVLRARSNSRAVLLYSDLETYLISLLKRGMWGRILGRKLFNNLASWSTLKLGLDAEEILELTDTQVASLAWLMHIDHFSAMAKGFGPRVKLLDSGNLFADPEATLNELVTDFGLGLGEQDVEQIVSGSVFSKHSKFTDRDYSVEERRRESESVGSANAEELSMVTKWIESFAAHHGIPLRPSA